MSNDTLFLHTMQAFEKFFADPVDSRIDLERPALSPQPHACMGDSQLGKLATGATHGSAFRAAEPLSISLSNGELVKLEIHNWSAHGSAMWSCGDAENCDRRCGWGRTQDEAIEDFRSVCEDRIPEAL